MADEHRHEWEPYYDNAPEETDLYCRGCEMYFGDWARARIAELERENAELRELGATEAARLAVFAGGTIERLERDNAALREQVQWQGEAAQRLTDQAGGAIARLEARAKAAEAWQEQARPIVQAVADDLDAGMTIEDINDAAQRLYALLATEARGEETGETPAAPGAFADEWQAMEDDNS